jgi:hypothetical protein
MVLVENILLYWQWKLKPTNFLQTLESGKFLPVPRSDEERIFA